MTTRKVLELLTIAAGIVFVGLCIQAAAQGIVLGIDILRMHLLVKDESYNWFKENWHSIVISFLSIWTSILKAYLFFWVFKITTRINIDKPFSTSVGQLISQMYHVALKIGILGLIIHISAKTFMKQGLTVPEYSAGQEYLFFAGILFVLAQIFKRGIELQNENELTV